MASKPLSSPRKATSASGLPDSSPSLTTRSVGSVRSGAALTSEASVSKVGAKPSLGKLSMNSSIGSEGTELSKGRTKDQRAKDAIAAAADGLNGTAARAAAMEATQKALEAMKAVHRAHKVSEAPNLVRAELETVRFQHNRALQKKIAFEHRVEERRVRLEKLCGSKAEMTRMLSVHAASREDTRRDVLRDTLRAELDMLKVLKKNGVKSFAGLADAYG